MSTGINGKPIVILNAEEAKCIYSQLTEGDNVTLGITTKIIKAFPSVRNTKNSFAKNLMLYLETIFIERL